MTKIVVIKKKKLFLVLAIILCIIIALCIVLFIGLTEKNSKNIENSSQNTLSASADVSENPDTTYIPGVYSKYIDIGVYSAELKVLADKEQIKNVELIYQDVEVETMYPLMDPAINSINEQLRSGLLPSEVAAADGNAYTYELLMNEITELLYNAS